MQPSSECELSLKRGKIQPVGLTIMETPAPQFSNRAPNDSFPFLRHCEHITEKLLKDAQVVSLVGSLSPLNVGPASALVGNRCPDDSYAAQHGRASLP